MNWSLRADFLELIGKTRNPNYVISNLTYLRRISYKTKVSGLSTKPLVAVLAVKLGSTVVLLASQYLV